MSKELRQYGNSIQFRLLKWLHPLLMTALVLLCWSRVYVPYYHLDVPLYSYGMLATAYIVMLYFLDKVYHALAVGLIRVSELVYSQSLAILISGGMAYLAGCLFCRLYITLIPLMGLLAVQFVICVFWSLAANWIYYRNYPIPRTAILYKTQEDLQRIRSIGYFEDRFNVCTLIKDPTNDFDAIREKLANVQVVFAGGIDHALHAQVAKFCVEQGKRAYFMPTLEDVILSGAEYMPMFAEPVMKIQRAQRNTGYLATKRGIDVVIAAVGLVVASPIMLITAAAIKLYDGGPVFYRQRRLTLEGRVFSILKFRSMNANAEKDGIARLASENDSRITPVGKIIRSTRIDELPQLINILLGDMSLVGPRPERPEIAAEYEAILPEFALRLQVRAGLTGMAQVYGRYNTDPYNKLKMDLIYINKLSLLTDFRLLFATVKILFLKESTEGVPQGQKTAAESAQKKSA